MERHANHDSGPMACPRGLAPAGLGEVDLFGPGASEHWHDAMITGHVDALIDGWIAGDRIDFVAQFARPLPQRTMASVLGIPQDDIPRL